MSWVLLIGLGKGPLQVLLLEVWYEEKSICCCRKEECQAKESAHDAENEGHAMWLQWLWSHVCV